MADLLEVFAEFSYFGIFLTLIAVNAAPLFMPPTWIILSSFYVIDPALDPAVLAIVGATGATIGRLVLKQASGFFRRFAGREQKSNLEAIEDYLNRKKFGYVLISFLFAATPLPSNMLFVTYGLMRTKNIGTYVGFWLGRMISYYIMISISKLVLTPFLQLFEDRLVGILVADAVGIGIVVFFMTINWSLLLTQKRLKFVRPGIWRF